MPEPWRNWSRQVGGLLRPGPDFLCIGAQKAGTSWLYQQLRGHPELFVPGVKELHYFNHAPRRWLPQAMLRRRLRKELRKMRQQLPRHAWPLRLAYLAQVFFAPRGPAWYRGLFLPGAGRVRGELTPCYAILDDGGLRRMRAEFPGLRFLFLLRDPIDRAWSGARMTLDAAAIARDEDCIAFFAGPGCRRRNLYTRSIDRFAALFGPERMHVGFFDRIASDPLGLLRDVYRFLGVDPDPPPGPLLRRRVYRGRALPLRPALERWLARDLLPELRELSARFGEPASSWLRRAERAAR